MSKRNLTPAEKVFKAVATTPGQSRIDYAKATRLETPVVGRAFQTLKREGVITMKGDRRGASYTIARNKATAEKMAELGLTVTRTASTTKKATKKAEPKVEKAEPTKAKRVRPSRSKAAIAARQAEKAEKAETPAPESTEAVNS